MVNRLQGLCGGIEAPVAFSRARPIIQNSLSNRGAARHRRSLLCQSVEKDDLTRTSLWDSDDGACSPTGVAFNNQGVYINSNFDSGNVEVLDMQDVSNIQLRIHKDPVCEEDGREHFQWFYYRVTGAKHTGLKMHICNAGKSTFPQGWVGYRACASYDRKCWFRVDSEYDPVTGVFTIAHRPEHDAIFYAYFAPYTFDMHMQLISDMQEREGVRLEMLGETLDGHDLDLLVIGEPGPDKARIWVTARQHPGETMAEYFTEGMMWRLTDRNDALCRWLLQRAVFYVVPNMNPDGSWRGQFRTNAHGCNLNREWVRACADDSPEVYMVKCKMEQTGCDMLVDVHGNATYPYNFLLGADGIPRWTPRLQQLQSDFCDGYARASPEFQTAMGYPKDEPGTAYMGAARNAVAQHFDCLAVTLEQPFKDHNDFPDATQGWSPERARHYGASILNPIAEIVPQLQNRAA